ncbi:MAG TPA: DUF6152 family protein [Gammaproteobacteria bacterium]|nr:DUF6152 family protein [Gammaproteobacteria bacterium]
MSQRNSSSWSLLVVGVTLAAPISAHHSFGAEYDVNAPITLRGVLTKIEWTNPHTHIYLDVKDEKGTVVNWQLEGYPPVALHRIGWKRDVTMKVGDTVTVTGWRARDGGAWGHSREITLASGEKMMFGPPAGTGDGGGSPAVDVR